MEDEDDDMRAQENQKILDDINECMEKNNGMWLVAFWNPLNQIPKIILTL